jgi:ubiquinone/menaquinone biosynthesis C-methylase UbiE
LNLKFKDYFSDGSDAYNIYRPRYPGKLFAYLSSITQSHQRAWDCATGNGQSAIGLSKYYSEVIGTDASTNQIDSAIKIKGVTYRVEPAETSKFDNESIDLIRASSITITF